MNEINLKLDTDRYCSIENNVLSAPKEKSESLNLRLPAYNLESDQEFMNRQEGALIFGEGRLN